MPDLSAELEELVVDTDRGGPAAEAALLGQLQAQQRHDVCAVRVHRLRQRSRIHARCGRLDVVSNVPITENCLLGPCAVMHVLERIRKHDWYQHKTLCCGKT